MRFKKTRKPTEGGRLVTRAQHHAALQDAANKIVGHIGAAMDKLQAENDARLTRIEDKLGLTKPGPKLVDISDIREGGIATIPGALGVDYEARSTPPSVA